MTTIKNGFKSTQFLLVNYCFVIFLYFFQKKKKKKNTKHLYLVEGNAGQQKNNQASRTPYDCKDENDTVRIHFTDMHT